MLTPAPAAVVDTAAASALRALNLDPTPALRAWASRLLDECRSRYAGKEDEPAALAHELACGAVPIPTPEVAALMAEDGGALMLREPVTDPESVWTGSSRPMIQLAGAILYDAAREIATHELVRLDAEADDLDAEADEAGADELPPFALCICNHVRRRHRAGRGVCEVCEGNPDPAACQRFRHAEGGPR